MIDQGPAAVAVVAPDERERAFAAAAAGTPVVVTGSGVESAHLVRELVERGARVVHFAASLEVPDAPAAIAEMTAEIFGGGGAEVG